MTKGIVQRGDLWPECVKEWKNNIRYSHVSSHMLPAKTDSHAPLNCLELELDLQLTELELYPLSLQGNTHPN